MPQKVKLRVGCNLSLLDPLVVSSTRPTPVATYDTVPYGVAQLQVLALFDDQVDAMVANLQVALLEKRLKIHSIALAPALVLCLRFIFIHSNHVFLVCWFL